MLVQADHLRGLTVDDRDQLETAVEEFESAWERGPRPDLDDFLPADGPLRHALAVELALADLEYRRRAGEAASADDYLRRYPELRAVGGAETELRAAESRWDGLHPVTDRGLNKEPPVIAGYELLGELGRGGMGVVYRARQIAADRIVALKMIRTDGPAEPDLLARFRTEAESAARLQHPNIVQIFEVGAAAGRPFFAMEFVEGGSLAERLTLGPLPPADAAGMLLSLARAIAAAHARGVLHRDLKPANVLLASRGREPPETPGAGVPAEAGSPPGSPKITDFGLAKRLDRASDQTKTGAFLGTPSFMAPEQAAGPSRELTPAADIYSLGATLYACLTGRPPFQAATVLETIEQLKSREPVSPRLLQPTVPRDLETICLKCLQKEPGRRYTTAAALADDLERFRAGRPILARPAGRTERVVRWCRRNPAIAGLAAALAFLLPTALVTVTVLYVRAEQQRAAAAAAAARAEQKSELARTTVDEVLLRLGNTLVDTQDIPKLRRAMYDKGLALYRRFAEEPGGATPEVRRSIGRLLARLATADTDLGRLSEARDSLRQAEDMLRQLVQEQPDDALARKTLAETLQSLGQLLRKTGDGAGAAAAFREAAGFYEPTSQGYKTSLNNLSIVLMESGQAEPALAALKELVDRQRRALTAAPNDPAAAGWLGLYLTNCALTQSQLGQRAQAAESLRESIALYERSAAAVPKAPSYRVGLADGYLNYGGVLVCLERFDEAIAAYRRAIEVRTPLAADFPNLPGHRHRLAAAYTELAGVLILAGRLTEVDHEIDRALVILERLVAESPKVLEYRVTLSSALGNRGAALRRSGKADDALPWLDRSIALVEGQAAVLADPENRHNLAQGYHSRARALATLGRHEEAIHDWDKAIPLAAEKDRKEMETDRAKSVARPGARQTTP